MRVELCNCDWDFIKAKTLTSGKSSDIVKQEIEAVLREYVNRQGVSYVQAVVRCNAYDGFKCSESLNELIAKALLLEARDLNQMNFFCNMSGGVCYDV